MSMSSSESLSCGTVFCINMHVYYVLYTILVGGCALSWFRGDLYFNDSIIMGSSVWVVRKGAVSSV
jgi:hypothetical protein